MVRQRVVVVGASIAGVTVVDELRRRGFTGELTLVGDDPHPAYNRPALSKGFLSGTDTLASITLPALSCEVDQRIGATAIGLDTDRREVLLADGDRLPFGRLVIATGARARTMTDLGAADPGAEESTFRDVADARDLRDRLVDRPRVVIVGAGILGMELASTCAAAGSAVTVVDRQPPLRAQLGRFLSDLVVEAATAHGVTLAHHPAGVRLRGSGTPAAELADGRRFDGDLVISAVGCRPDVEWLAGSGLVTDGDLRIDDRCRVAAGILAAGDVAAFPGDHGHRRTPWWTSALDQARTAAATLLDDDAGAPLVPSPYFWTEQFGITLRVCGPLPVRGRPTVVAGSPAEGLLLTWPDGRDGATAAAVNRRIPISRLRALTRATPSDPPMEARR
ncbi:pyridine nucleotide-disulfide oxidoreductase [Pseudonocardia sulfidoxydans NBRC 16205]|uniref:Pyridine nucleotide-disulfide oxidoreductase n=2 Tax=Pseudonocardia sulfidoxydans TaxID=54011 RepID=A0A511DB29_9PSEU|nr:FAD-dependent oxidoreductase [Pseudonocardia sulfidoxydans]GEL21777.1 pyridine nucleotide-disulfide oxidoreductase [Pseudonocardia sulfidoxydans NBRC 16205]